MGSIRIGTSGWHYKHWRGPFYPAGLPASAMLEFYQQRFDTVEVNNSFYRLPLASTFEKWGRMTSADFCFAVKASRYLTHLKRLKDPEQGLQRFFPLVDLLAEKLGPILFQLPPRWPCDVDRLNGFLAALPGRHRYTFEFRDPSWHTPAIYRLLARHNIAFCIYESSAFGCSPQEVTADFSYVRLHGPGSYAEAMLACWAERIRKWQADLKAVYVYFNNDQAGYAVQNALQLKKCLQ